MAGTCGHREQTLPRKLIFTTILDIRCKLFIYIEKVGRLGLEPRTKALKVRCRTIAPRECGNAVGTTLEGMLDFRP